MREKDIEKAVTDYAKSLGWLSFKFTSPNNRGVPDRIFFRAGRVILIEFKAPGKRPTRLQQRTIENFINAGIETHVIDCKEKGRAIFNA